jgi:hypothetical protein
MWWFWDGCATKGSFVPSKIVYVRSRGRPTSGESGE